MTIRKIVFSWSVLILGTLIFSACGSSHRSQKSYTEPYVYSDPRSGDPVPMRVSAESEDDQSADEKIQFSLDNARVQIKSNYVTLNLDKTVRGATEHIELAGTLASDSSAQLDDTAPVDGKSRMKGYLHCTADQCAELYVEVYFYLDGERTSRQLNVRNIENDLKVKIAAAEPPVQTPTLPEPAPHSNVYIRPGAPPPPATNDDDVEANHGSDEGLTDSGNGVFISPEPDETFLQNLKPDVAPEKIKKPKPVAPSANEPFNFENLILSGGGSSVNSPDRGSITQSGTLMPKAGVGFRRVSLDSKAHGTGYSVSFMKEAAANFTHMHPECGEVTIRNMSPAFGGPLVFDHPVAGQTQAASHQNGLDFDVAYLPLTDLRRVIHNGKIDSDFAMACNYNWFKYLSNLRLPNSGRLLVHLILVHTVMKKGLCQYQHDNGLYSAADKHMQNTLYWTPNAHDDHAHIRLYCSPKHNDCYDGSADPQHFKCPGDLDVQNI